ncbi:MAG: DsbA family protein [Gammaproteobacteria bacterium]|nr:DsbA family protein [Gammaproteobacteria bacterium]MDH3464941.1 DsbA family protein [Gammaproteobacteria bacterium]
MNRKLFLPPFWALVAATVLASNLAQATEVPQETYQDMPVGFTDEGYAFVGNPDASVILEEWSDYLCPFCGRHFSQTLPGLLDQYVRGGKVKLVFRDFPLVSLHPTAPKGHVAALCVGEQSAARYWAMHDALFQRQQEWNRLPDPSDFLADVAKEVGADMAALEACIAKGDKQAFVDRSVQEGQALGYNGTPSFRFASIKHDETYNLVGAQPIARFARLADPLIAGEKPPEEPKPEPPELPQWAKPEGLVPDPTRPGYNQAGDAYKGDPKAKLVVVEFNDFQCPACRRHALEGQPRIDTELVDTGKVLWVTKHFPLRIHPYAALAAVTAECAGEQGKFWEMHHLLFDQTDQWATEDAENALVALAESVPLDHSRFVTCFNGRKGLERVLHDLYDAQGVVQSTPTFIIIAGGRGSVMKGARPADQFIALLSKRLEAIAAGEESPNKASAASPATAAPPGS